MAFTVRQTSIRRRLFLLVLALWVPAVAGLALQAYSGYSSQKESLQEEMQQQAMALRFAIDTEIDRRLTLARALATLPSLQAGDLATFERVARAAVKDSTERVLLLDREQQYFNTGAPAATMVPRHPGSLFVTSGMGISYVPQGPLTQAPTMAVLVPESGRTPPRYNVGVPFPPARVQDLIQQQRLRAATVASVIDSQQRVMGRSRDPARWIGQRASYPALLEMAVRGDSGFLETRTLDNVASLTYLSPPGRYGWAVVFALPEQALTNAAWAIALRAVASSAALLLIGLGLAIVAARRITQPVKMLQQAAGALLDQRVPAPLSTGLLEIDRVGEVLHHAGQRAHEWGSVLEARVREASEEARKAEASLFEARKHEAIGRLTGAIAHDFNNLLQTISMGLQVVHRAVPEGKHTKSLQAALAASGRAADQIRQMLAFGRTQQLRPQPVNLADLLLRSQDLTDKALGERVRLMAQLEPDLPALMADPIQLELALLNLVFNARDAMRDHGGTVRLRASVVDGSSVGLDAPRLLRIDVEDDGPGMDAETLSRVFEPYFTTKPVGAGTGLGLPQVQAFARQSQGDVRIASTPGTGTCVSLFLPVAATDAGAAEINVQHARRSDRVLRVLMVEDDVLVASVVMAALEHAGHFVILCRTADEARALLEHEQSIDVLFTDVMMPGSMTGLELVAWCKDNRAELPALVATGYSARPAEGVCKLLRKPYTIEDLLDALDACTVGQSVLRV
jgi:signal transduction histidine kinase/ActR/RegA family two-component response regulator